MKIKIIAIALAFLAFFVFVGSPFEQAAQAIAVVDDVAFIAVLVAALAAMGITFWTDGAYANIKDEVYDLYSDFCQSKGITIEQSLKSSAFGRNNVSKVLLNPGIIEIFQEFGEWLVDTLGLSNNETNTIVQGNYKLFDDLGNQYNVSTESSPTSGTPIAYFQKGMDSHTELSFGDGALELNIDFVNDNLNMGWYDSITEEFGTSGISIYYFGDGYTMGNVYFTYLPGDGENPPGVYFSLVYMSNAAGTKRNSAAFRIKMLSGYMKDASVEVRTGVINLPEDDSEYQEGDGAILDVGASWGVSLPDITGRVIPGEFSDSNVAHTSITYDQESVIEEELTDAGSPTVGEEPEDYQTPGLQNVFPFCIPFDIYNFFNCLAADPVAPSFEWRFYVPGICDETIELDLEQFDTVAQIVRTMELLAFIVGLAFVTRDKMIKG